MEPQNIENPRRNWGYSELEEKATQTTNWEDLQLLDERQKVNNAMKKTQPGINFRLICCTKPKNISYATSARRQRLCLDDDEDEIRPQTKPSRSTKTKKMCSIQ